MFKRGIFFNSASGEDLMKSLLLILRVNVTPTNFQYSNGMTNYTLIYLEVKVEKNCANEQCGDYCEKL